MWEVIESVVEGNHHHRACVHKCNTFDGLCKDGKLYYKDVLYYMFVSLKPHIAIGNALIKISAFDEKGRFLPGAVFTLQNPTHVPFRITKEADAKAHVFATHPLINNSLHSMLIKAVSKDLDRSDLILKSTFNIHVSVAEYDF